MLRALDLLKSQSHKQDVEHERAKIYSIVLQRLNMEAGSCDSRDRATWCARRAAAIIATLEVRCLMCREWMLASRAMITLLPMPAVQQESTCAHVHTSARGCNVGGSSACSSGAPRHVLLDLLPYCNSPASATCQNRLM